MTRRWEIARFVLGVLALTAVSTTLWLVLWVTAVPVARSWSPVAVTSGSMTPAVDVGDVVLTAPFDSEETLAPGTVIVFDNPAAAGLLTHRVVAVNALGDYVTQGDANARVDSATVPPASIRGVGRVRVPAIGMFVVWVTQGHWLRLALVTMALGAAAWASRWAVVPTFNPWRSRASTEASEPARPPRLAGAALGVVVVVGLAANPLGPSRQTSAAFADATAAAGNSFAVDEWTSIVDLGGGTAHACLARSAGHVWCWGLNGDGQLGDGTTTDRWVPVQVSGPGGTGSLTDAVELGVGATHTCAALSDWTAWCWGRNDKGQLGDTTTTDSTSPVQVAGPGGSGTLTSVVEVVGGLSHSCASRTDGTVWCWGLNDRGQLGDGTTTTSAVPVQVTGAGGTGVLTDVVALTARAKFTCAVKTDTTVWCWGDNTNDQLGDTTGSNSSWPVQVTGPGGVGQLTGATHVTAGETFACVAKTDGTAWCWGLNDKGQLGDNTTTDRLTPVQVTGPGGSGTLSNVSSVAAGLEHTCAVKTDGTTWCWGRNDKGQLGDNTTTDSTSPVQVTGPGGSGTLTGATLVGAGDAFGCAALSDWTAWCWGRNDKGQLGDNTTTDRLTPVQVKGGGWTGIFADAREVVAGTGHSCAARTDGTVWCWGLNDRGQLGDGTTTTSAVPVQVTGAGGTGVLTDVVALTARAKFTCAVKTDTTVWCWGDNTNDQLGDTTGSNSSWPVQVTGPGGVGQLTGATHVTAGETFACVAKTDGTVWCWGLNDKGQLGDNTTTDRLTPVQVTGPGGSGTLSNVSSVAAGLEHTCAVKTDGTTWCWGRNDKGQLGDNTTTDSTSPVQVTGPAGSGTLTGVTRIGIGGSHSCAVKTDTSVWCWGLNNKGQLGDNTTTDSASPVQVTGSGGSGTLAGVEMASAGLQHSCAVRTDETMWCWGDNAKGQLGDGSTADSAVPVQVVDAGGVGTISDASTGGSGDIHTCVVRADESTWCWGDNGAGRLGDGTTNGSPTPVQVL